MDYLSNLVKDRLGLDRNQSSDRNLLDIGGGTGNFTRRLVEGNSNIKAIVVDPFLDGSSSSSQTSDDDCKQLQFVKAGAERFAAPMTQEEEWWRSGYHQVLLKEVVHHLDAKNRVAIFRGMREELLPLSNNLPSLLIITRPQYNHDYPLWIEARNVWADNQPSLETFQNELEDAGFHNVNHSIEAYPCSTHLERWLDMIKARFWSTFSNFSDDELNEACERIRRNEANRIDEDGNIHFEDRLLFITAQK